MRSLWAPVLLVAACGAGPGRGAGAAGGASGARGTEVVARIDDVVITVADLERQIEQAAGQSAFVRARYSTPQQKREFLEQLVRFEVMAREARSRGYDRDPDVQRVFKNQMIAQLVRKEFEAKVKPEDVAEAELEKYFQGHAEEFRRPEEVRVSQIFTVDRAKAQRAAAEARALGRGGDKSFRDLVARLSEDEDSKPRGGDLTFFDRNTPNYPKPLVEAAFALGEVGDVSAPVQSDRGWHVLRLTQKRPGFSRPFAEVKNEIRMRLYREMRSKKMEEFVAEMKNKVKVEINEAELARVTVP